MVMNYIERAIESDAQELLSLQKLAFISVAELEGYEIQPLTQTVEDVKEAFDSNFILKYVHKKEIIGSVRAFEKDGTCYISRLMVHPNSQNRGIGKELMKEIETIFGNVRFELFTASINSKNISFYEKLGYKGYKTGKLAGIESHFLFMEKCY
jgi:ribosomal protein S18 acetylase RimI-like enzyme